MFFLSKRKIYVCLLLLLILFVSLSFSFILKIPIIEGNCLPNCDSAQVDPTKDDLPNCKANEGKLLQKGDANGIYKKCIKPFIQNINNTY